MNMVTTFSSLFAGAALASSSALAQSAAFQTEKVPVEAKSLIAHVDIPDAVLRP